MSTATLLTTPVILWLKYWPILTFLLLDLQVYAHLPLLLIICLDELEMTEKDHTNGDEVKEDDRDEWVVTKEEGQVINTWMDEVQDADGCGK